MGINIGKNIAHLVLPDTFYCENESHSGIEFCVRI